GVLDILKNAAKNILAHAAEQI
uniref:Ocellatin-3 n=1 Tax=Leptodactylus ocellatus TaxID=928525 RepID=OCE3_LEPOE|nr:RecName: Full=Ocellatin-3 [Leptodactylus bolivianus]